MLDADDILERIADPRLSTVGVMFIVCAMISNLILPEWLTIYTAWPVEDNIRLAVVVASLLVLQTAAIQNHLAAIILATCLCLVVDRRGFFCTCLLIFLAQTSLTVYERF